MRFRIDDSKLVFWTTAPWWASSSATLGIEDPTSPRFIHLSIHEPAQEDWLDGVASSSLGIEERADVPIISVSEKGSINTLISKESSVHGVERDGPEPEFEGIMSPLPAQQIRKGRAKLMQ